MEKALVENAGLATKALHAGLELQQSESQTEIVHRTTAFHFKNSEHAANLFGLKELGQIYTRLTNPTQDMLEARMAALDGGAAALAVASGTSAIFYTIINILKHGDEIVASRNLYGGTYVMLTSILPQFGIKAVLVDPTSKLEEFENAINERTRLIFVETIGNPLLELIDLEAIAKIAQKHKLPLAVDSTFTPPCLLRPIEYGANIVIHSLTKWYNGHANLIAGGVVDAGNFDWSDPKFTLYNEPEESYHGLRFGHDLGALQALAFILRMRTIPLRNLGAAIAPDNAWQVLQGVKTLSLRLERQSENALKLAHFLQGHEAVQWVRYPGLKEDPSYSLAQKYLPVSSQNSKGGQLAGGMISIALKGGVTEGKQFIDKLKLFSQVANVGDVRSLAIHPASTTHSQLSDEELASAGVDQGLVRLSIGIEDFADLQKDITQALS